MAEEEYEIVCLVSSDFNAEVAAHWLGSLPNTSTVTYTQAWGSGMVNKHTCYIKRVLSFTAIPTQPGWAKIIAMVEQREHSEEDYDMELYKRLGEHGKVVKKF